MLELNQEQKLAAEHSSSRLLVLAGPGTGKTRRLLKLTISIPLN